MVEIYVLPLGFATIYIVEISEPAALSIIVHRDGTIMLRVS